MRPFQNPDDDTIRELLERVRRIAVVGLSPKPHRASHRVASDLQEAGYDIVPVNPGRSAFWGRGSFAASGTSRHRSTS